MKKISLFLIIFMVFSLVITPVIMASLVEKPDKPIEEPGNPSPVTPEIIKGNNGFGNGNQDAPGNSLNHNNAENSRHDREYPGKSKHEK